MPYRPRILVTRAPQQASELAERLRVLGADPILIPAIETVSPASFDPLDAALGNLSSFHWLIFTSANAVAAFEARRKFHSRPMLDFRFQTASIGTATTHALQSIGLAPALVPPQAVAESLADALLPYASQADATPTRFLLVRAEEAREYLPEALRAAGAEVTIAPAYRTVIPPNSVDAVRELFSSPENYPAAVTFTSSSTARNLLALLASARVVMPMEVVRASIGPITSATLRELGYPPQVEALEANTASLAEALVAHLKMTLR